MAQIEIATDDGRCPTHVFRPTTNGPWPAVLVYMDGIGIRPALCELAEKIAQHGYYVMLPDLFYRAGAYTAPEPRLLFSDPEFRARWAGTYIASANQANVMRDTRAFLDYLSAQPDVLQPRVGTTGYCMGGGLSLSAAGFYPDRIAAAASFHGGNLATDQPTSPHLVAARIKGRVYVAGAIEDPSFPDQMKQRLEQSMTEAGVDLRIETYPARHGWVPRDTPSHDPVQSERHYTELLALFDRTLRG